jgi:archaellum component FlaC
MSYVSGHVFNVNDIGDLVVDAVEKLLADKDEKIEELEHELEQAENRYADLHSDFISLEVSLTKAEQENLDKLDIIEQLEQRIRELQQEILQND